MAEEKLYCGKAKVRNTQYGELMSLSVCLDDIPKEWQKESRSNGKTYINLTVTEMRSPDNYGNTHTVFVDTFVPNSKRASKPVERYRSDNGPEDFDDDKIPF